MVHDKKWPDIDDAGQYLPARIIVDSYGNPVGFEGDPGYDFGLQVARGEVRLHSIVNVIGERASVGTTVSGEDIWLGTATSLPDPATAGEQMTIISSNTADAGKLDGVIDTATHATNLNDASAAFATAPVVLPGDTVFNLTDGSQTTVASVTSDALIVTNALTGGTNNVWTIGDAYHLNSGGTGVHAVEIHYLDGSGLEQEEIIILNGTTGVNTSATDISFINNMYSVDVGSGGVSAGNIIIYRLGAATRIYDMLATGGNMTLTCRYKVPSDKTFYINHWGASVTSGTAAKPSSVRLRATCHDELVAPLLPGVFLFKSTAYLESSGIEIPRSPSIIIPSDAVVKVSSWATGAGGQCAAHFDGYLIDNAA